MQPLGEFREAVDGAVKGVPRPNVDTEGPEGLDRPDVAASPEEFAVRVGGHLPGQQAVHHVKRGGDPEDVLVGVVREAGVSGQEPATAFEIPPVIGARNP